jgi:hypothetical protein
VGSNPAFCVTALRHVTIASYSRRAPPTTTDLANRWLTLPRHQAQRTQWTLRTRCPIHTSAPLARSLGSPCPNPQGSSRDGPGQWPQWQVELVAKYAELMGGSRHKGRAQAPTTAACSTFCSPWAQNSSYCPSSSRTSENPAHTKLVEYVFPRRWANMCLTGKRFLSRSQITILDAA